ncbi:MAG: efflux RND transporter periplasmic adaptor subunit [Glaciecola sp.]|jgi:membrane fusion protein (multidrug efflux system)|nr:efflux RND transporter periplasmic adaptor subunit [Glaciecola sp.]MDG1469622.1 efflux RND transporter periplasmic adaptor subunit [Glaciecola sp.]MDG1921439.1 efflux RND transporter periplasmic adaptor subunit [Glaciecola sp.]
MSKRVSFSPLWVGVLALVGFLVFINWPVEELAQRQGNRATPVVTQIVSIQPFAVTLQALGTAKANESVMITPQESDVITSLNFSDGQQVEAGTILAQLNSNEQKARLNELNINLAEAERQLKRIQNLALSNSTSTQLLDEQQARVKAFIAQREVAQENLNKTFITAPFSGRLGLRQVSLGAYVKPGDVLTTLDDIATIKVDFAISERHLPSVNEGQTVFAESIAYPGIQFEGTITNVDSRIDPATRSFSIRTEIDNTAEQLRPGMLLTITLQKRVLNTLVIDEKALVPDHKDQFVFRVVDGKAVKTKVIIGERRPGMVQVLDGVAIDDEIVVQGTLRIRDGSELRVLNSTQG